VEEALARPRREPQLPAITLDPRRRPRVLVYTGTVVPVPTGDKADPSWLLRELLPDDCEVDVASCRPLDFRPLRDYDLVLFGLGDCFYEPVLSQPGLARFLCAARCCVGVFGLQYPESLPLEPVREVLGALSHWFALYQRDLTTHGGMARRADRL